MQRNDRKIQSSWHARAFVACLFGVACAAGSSRAADVTVPGTDDFPESITASADGTLFFSSMAGGRIFRAAHGAARATEWVKQGGSGLSSVLGVLADAKSNTLYACSSDMSWADLEIPNSDKTTSLKMFDLVTGAPKGSIPLPPSTLLGQASLCNDIAISADNTVYVTDSLAGHILRLKPGSKTLDVWAHDARWDVKAPQLDGIAVTGNGPVYANLFEGDGLYRIDVKPDGNAGAITRLETSQPLYHADGLRALGNGKLLMVEGETKGTLDRITVEGDKARIETIKDGFEGPVALTQVGDTVYVLDVPEKYLFDPDMKAEKPPPFTAFAVELPK